MALSVTAWAHTAFPELSADRPYPQPGDVAALDPQGTSSDRLGDIVLSRAEPSLTALTNAARLDGFSDFIKSKTGVETRDAFAGHRQLGGLAALARTCQGD